MACLLVVVTTGSGCGYRFVGTGDLLPEGIEKVFAPMMVNKTPEPALEVVFTEALRERLMKAGALGGRDSLAEVKGELYGLGTGAGLVRNVGTATPGYASYRVSASLRLTLVKGDKVLARSESSGTEEYLPDANNDVLTLEAQRQAALRRLAETLVRDGFERLAGSGT